MKQTPEVILDNMIKLTLCFSVGPHNFGPELVWHLCQPNTS